MSGDREARKVVVVRRKARGHDEHHGGSWKVAYADFVTAMMAFFLVMWIMSMDQGVKDLVQGYFQNPVGFKKTYSGGRNVLSQGNSVVSQDVRAAMLLRRQEEEARLRDAARRLETRLETAALLDGEAAVEVVVTDAGLRVEMMETGAGEVFFERGSAELKPALRRVLGVVAAELATLPETVVLEGHTDALRFGRSGYSNWELSVDRANAARRELLAGTLPEGRIVEVRGYASRQPKVAGDPLDPRNRRISVLLPFLSPHPDALERAGALLLPVGSERRTGADSGGDR